MLIAYISKRRIAHYEAHIYTYIERYIIQVWFEECLHDDSESILQPRMTCRRRPNSYIYIYAPVAGRQVVLGYIWLSASPVRLFKLFS